MTSKWDRERVLRELFFPDLAGARPHELELSPQLGELQEFANLLLADRAEEDLQRFLARHPMFLIGEAGFSDSSTLAFMTKPRIGTRFVGDFAVLQANQGGCSIHLYEIKRSSAPLFTKGLTPAQPYQAAIGQVTKWRRWIEADRRHFASEMLVAAKRLPQWPRRSPNRSFRVPEVGRIDSLWQIFGGDEHPSFSYTIICGRWANLSAEQQQTLVFLNSKGGNWYTTRTYDQLARDAYRRPLTDWGTEAE